MTETTAITPAMCVAASDAAMERGIILPASHAGDILAAALSATPPALSSPAPAKRFATPDHVVSEVWKHLPKTPAMWEVVEPMSPPPLWLYEAMDKALAMLPAPAVAEGWRPMDSVPKDGELLRLLIELQHGGDDQFPTADVGVGETWHTIGANSADHTGQDEWQFAGWDWSHDCWTEGRGKVVGWLPYRSAPVAAPTAMQEEALPYGPHDVMINGGRHSAIAVMNAMDAVSATPPAGEGREALDNGWFIVNDGHPDSYDAIHGPQGLIACGLTAEQSRALVEAHGALAARTKEG